MEVANYQQQKDRTEAATVGLLLSPGTCSLAPSCCREPLCLLWLLGVTSILCQQHLWPTLGISALSSQESLTLCMGHQRTCSARLVSRSPVFVGISWGRGFGHNRIASTPGSPRYCLGCCHSLLIGCAFRSQAHMMAVCDSCPLAC